MGEETRQPHGFNTNVAPIKKEYIIDVPPEASTTITKEVPVSKRQKRKQMRQDMRSGMPKDMCMAVLKGRTCKFGDKCRASHDLASYLQTRPEDIGPRCYIYDVRGFCPHGVVCRFGSTHIKDGENVTDETKVASIDKSSWDELNYLPSASVMAMRKRTFKFPKTAKVFQDMNIDYNKKFFNMEDHIDASVDAYEPVRSRKPLDFHDKLILAPLTTVGNLPFRRICKQLYGADVTVGEMALGTSLLQGQQSEWALLRRHPSETMFGVQIASAQTDQLVRCVEAINRETPNVDFIDLNVGCPIDLVCDKGAGSFLLNRPKKLITMLKAMKRVSDIPITVKLRTGWNDEQVAHNIIAQAEEIGISAVTLHGRSRQQRYSKLADWSYIQECASVTTVPLIGNGDILSYSDYLKHKNTHGIDSMMIARGALIKPWIFTEIKEKQCDWDISASERLDMIRSYCNYGLEHWGSDSRGVATTRRFLLEWLSFLHRYIPVGLLEVLPQSINQRAPPFVGRSDLETLLSSSDVADWIRITEMFLGKAPDGMHFKPKHRANAYSTGEG